MDNKKTYKTKDLGEASMLLAKNKKLNSIKWEGKTGYFIFEDKQSCEELSNDYFMSEDVLVPARKFYDMQTRLKSRLFSHQDEDSNLI